MKDSRARNVDGQVDCRQLDHIHNALRDINCLVAHALEIGIDLGHRQNETEVFGHGLLHGEQIEGVLIDFPLGNVDHGFALKDHLAARQVAIDIGLASPIYGLFGEAAHTEQLLPEFVESLLKARTHYPNLPVM